MPAFSVPSQSLKTKLIKKTTAKEASKPLAAFNLDESDESDENSPGMCHIDSCFQLRFPTHIISGSCNADNMDSYFLLACMMFVGLAYTHVFLVKGLAFSKV